MRLLAVVIALAGLVVAFSGLLKCQDFGYGVQNDDYRKSEALAKELKRIYLTVNVLEKDFKNEEHIKRGGGITDKQIKMKTEELKRFRENELGNARHGNDYWSQDDNNKKTQLELDKIAKEKSDMINKIYKHYDDILKNVKQYIIQQKLSAFKSLKKEIDSYESYVYSVVENGKTIWGEDFKTVEKLPLYKIFPMTAQLNLPFEYNGNYLGYDTWRFLYENSYINNGTTYSNLDGKGSIIIEAVGDREIDQVINYKGVENKFIYVGVTESTYKERASKYNELHQSGLVGIYKTIFGFFAMLLGLIWLAYVAGRNGKDDNVIIKPADRIYLDIGLMLVVSVVSLCLAGVRNVIIELTVKSSSNEQLLYASGLVLIFAAFFVLARYVVMFAKRTKRGEVITHTLIYKVFKGIFQFINRAIENVLYFAKGGTIAIKTLKGVIFFSFGSVVTFFISYLIGGSLFGDIKPAFIFGILGMVVVEIYTFIFVLKRLKAFRTLVDGIQAIREGQLNYQIPMTGSATINSIAVDINNIADGLKVAVEKEVKAERMKVELVTNVSHDLKTPLTSIITYVNLLSQSELTPKEANDYVEIIKTKADRLKHLVEDLFDVSKAQSGVLAIKTEQLCLNDLISQVKAEYIEKFELVKLDIRINAPKDKINILADSSRMWRVLSNLFDNISKYTMENTRVYIEIGENENLATLTIKNISKYEMNFNKDEIAERFKRGDEARTGEGSGLGLSIVKSFVELQGGRFQIALDGDLFKVEISIPKDKGNSN